MFPLANSFMFSSYIRPLVLSFLTSIYTATIYFKYRRETVEFFKRRRKCADWKSRKKADSLRGLLSLAISIAIVNLQLQLLLGVTMTNRHRLAM
jgi:hypothetical protein